MGSLKDCHGSDDQEHKANARLMKILGSDAEMNESLDCFVKYWL